MTDGHDTKARRGASAGGTHGGLLESMPGGTLSDVLDSLSDLACLCLNGEIQHVNAAGLAILGARRVEDLRGVTFQSLICDDFAATIEDILATVADETEATPLRIKGVNGKMSSLAIRVRSLHDLAPHAYMVVGQNLTRQVELSEALHKGEVRFRRLVNSALDLICVLEGGVVTFINQAGLDLLKAAHEDQVVGKPFGDFLHSDYKEIMDGDLGELAAEDMLIPVRLTDTAQQNIDAELAITVLENGKAARCMIEARDITAHNRAVTALRHSIETLEQRVEERTRELQEEVMERRRAEEMLRHVASHDGLTDLPNRSLLMDRLDKAINRAHRDGRKCAVMFIDLDGFKPINDTLGHDMGDLLLREIARRLSANVRETDTASRFGGDEFVLVLSDLDKRDDVLPVAKKVLEAVCKPVDLVGKTASVGASIGVALYPDHGLTAEDVLKQADNAMYEVKGSGKNNYAFAPERPTLPGLETGRVALNT